ncbi:hypothetical protein CEUSTIGMA_g4744.t1 [Chlamydomonas eustigma]|uniref:LysM domain-containing protein n=1 Tax=Chlamydomonas eustigma TaxID=1157962 RepID=A0A250X2K6_9CHLO|nr:hypothetical protein CEUSTIGMA_g4744.t1 [Chlamydomonas eustigma]|eukprot:GAX77298.1 hypothetical protein CEUSTIGMA_g4744.t1 [Chlamydomonas eustigma]
MVHPALSLLILFLVTISPPDVSTLDNPEAGGSDGIVTEDRMEHIPASASAASVTGLISGKCQNSSQCSRSLLSLPSPSQRDGRGAVRDNVGNSGSRGPVTIDLFSGFPIDLTKTVPGCSYTVSNHGETLHSMGKSLDVMMDVLLALNPGKDLSNPSEVLPGDVLSIPCPGSSYPHFRPLYVAGCFFDYVIDAQHPSLLSLVKDPPKGVPGPFTVTGIWIANYQALKPGRSASNNSYNNSDRSSERWVDLTAPGQYTVGRKIFLPTCGHAGTLEDLVPGTGHPAEDCHLDLTKFNTASNISSNNISQVAKFLNMSSTQGIQTLYRLNSKESQTTASGRRTTDHHYGQKAGVQAEVALNISEGNEPLLPTSILKIPCPGSSALCGTLT